MGLPTTLFCTAFSFRLEPPIHASMMVSCLLDKVTNSLHLRTSKSESSALESVHRAHMRNQECLQSLLSNQDTTVKDGSA